MTRLSGLAAVLVVAAGAAVAGAAVAGNPFADHAGGASAAAACGVPPSLTAMEAAQAHLAARIDRRESLTIVAVGSSSTAGTGASAPDMSYPSRLEAELKERFPAIGIRVINRGKGGEDAAEELARLDRDVIAERPDLVIWQVGTNAVLRRDDLAADRELIERGVAKLKESGSDVVLMDLQYAPRVISRPAYAEMEQVIAQVAQRTGVGLFRRFEIMQHWQADAATTPEAIIGRDGLHMTDRGYSCLAANLAEALAESWWAREDSDERAPGAQVAGLAGAAPVAARSAAHAAR